jgi:hypothetical protein
MSVRQSHRRNRIAGSQRRRNDSGQAALALVLGLTMILLTGAGLLATQAIQHYPLIQNDAIQHYAYRGVEAGTNAYLADVNANSTLINCNSKAASNSFQCSPHDYETWTSIPGTGNVSEWYLWENPVFCFNTACTITGGASSAGLPLLYVRMQIWGAAGVLNKLAYQESTVNLKPVNGFLNNIFWSNYEATDPTDFGGVAADCTWNWANGEKGPDVTGSFCNPVVFTSADVLYGPVFTNDSVYIYGDPTLGPVTTADPNCTFVNGVSTAMCSTSVTQTQADAAANSNSASNFENLLPPADAAGSLSTLAKLHGCYYQGPTTVHFNSGGTMNVWSPDSTSPITNPSASSWTTSSSCLNGQGLAVNVPNGTNGNGVIYVDSASGSACKAGANPFDDWTADSFNENWAGGDYGPDAQIDGFKNYYNYTPTPDCEGDAFVGDTVPAATNTTGSVSGQLTIATENNVIVTDDIEYADCGWNSVAQFESPHTNQCAYNSTGTNDSLGLIAAGFVEVNHPVAPYCPASGCAPISTAGPLATTSTLPVCTAAQLATVQAALCDPGGSDGLVIDAAILAVSGSFAVNNEALNYEYPSGTVVQFGVGGLEGNLVVYGAIDQDWRGAVGAGSYSGYGKLYQWDSRLSAVSPPYYLDPGTASWELDSSSASVAAANSSGGGTP